VLKVNNVFQYRKDDNRQRGKNKIRTLSWHLWRRCKIYLKLKCFVKAALRWAFYACVYCMQLRFQRNYVGWLKPTQLHAVNTCVKRSSQRSFRPNSHTIFFHTLLRLKDIAIKRYKKNIFHPILFSCVNWKYLFLDNYTYWNLVWKYYKMSLQYFEQKRYLFISVLCAKILCVTLALSRGAEHHFSVRQRNNLQTV
jgi:hypothetical protein